MATRKTTTKKPASTTPKKTTVTLRALVRVAEDGGFDINGFGNQIGSADLNELREFAESNNYLDGLYEEYLIEIEVPAYSNFMQDVRFRLKVPTE